MNGKHTPPSFKDSAIALKLGPAGHKDLGDMTTHYEKCSSVESKEHLPMTTQLVQPPKAVSLKIHK